MIELVRTTLANNAKLAVVGVAAFALGGVGTAASVSLSGSSTPAPATTASVTETPDPTETAAPTETPDPT